ncbi:MAG: protease modulator HflC [Xanthomonadaceae bacterium]|nr:protease modulator HflC [Xanthomonadaceae bacterium]
MARYSTYLLVALAVGLFLLVNSLFMVDEREFAIKFRLGEIIKSDYEPGLHGKFPFVNNIRTFDARIQTLDARPERFLTVEKKNVIVDFYVKWRIADPVRFYTSTGGSSNTANALLLRIIQDGMRSEFGRRTIQEAVSGERAQIMSVLTRDTNASAQELGLTVLDVRVKRIDLPQEVSESVYQRMEAGRELVARQLRAEGSEAAERIRADAERQRTVLLAQGYREAEELRGSGDATAAEIYARAFNRNAEFYAFYRSLEAYRNSIGQDNDLLLIGPDSEFFRYLKDPARR